MSDEDRHYNGFQPLDPSQPLAPLCWEPSPPIEGEQQRCNRPRGHEGDHAWEYAFKPLTRKERHELLRWAIAFDQYEHELAVRLLATTQFLGPPLPPDWRDPRPVS